MNSDNNEVSAAIIEIRDLIRLMAEPVGAERDKKYRTELRRIVGSSIPKTKAALLMNGNNPQSVIVKETNIHKGQLSEFVKQLNISKLLSGDPKVPKLIIPIPSDFFEKGADNE